ncbi:hypothetical protein BBK36DRAFT_1198105 [Trichoderma citrinoviride]|uniref:SnoaL-like domain-containing protein n=1 Tax=Trichoderma citrinoviride TaxID=58853 RepID=A0A2T4BBH2_9HYPO|nr:hypothetical protein BBK36DRAFT_1198105 [Trichoderma citrinoviride]PTB66682.1 hypothetical protein BBK36DRAFT_1198105 [Trichoderma citrinoviride]
MGCTTRINARQEAIEVLVRYADGLDRGDAAQFESCFAEDAILDLSPFSVLGMTYQPIHGRAAITAECMKAVGTTLETTHSLTNFLVTLNETNDSASVSCLSEAQHVKKGHEFDTESQDTALIVKCRYEATIAQEGDSHRGSMSIFGK